MNIAELKTQCSTLTFAQSIKAIEQSGLKLTKIQDSSTFKKWAVDDNEEIFMIDLTKYDLSRRTYGQITFFWNK